MTYRHLSLLSAAFSVGLHSVSTKRLLFARFRSHAVMPKEKSKTNRRSENFTQDEIDILIRECISRKGTLCDPISANLTHSMKMQAWNNISEAVSYAAGNQRSVEELRVKLSNLKSTVKKAYNKRKRLMGGTGGGPPPAPLEQWQDLLIDFMGQEALDGVIGGVETPTGFSERSADTSSSNKACELGALTTLASLATGRKKMSDPKSMADTSIEYEETASNSAQSASSSKSKSSTPEKLQSRKSPCKPETKAMAEWLETEKERLSLKRQKMDEQVRHNTRMEELAAERLTVEKEKRDMLRFLITTFSSTTNTVQLLPANYI
ncbi:uncharacterized protein LOC121412519 [Lytechinus variegatus]|uniref:uncharacterized protein LOC121412519 n=1 Tax=Lytechinus variegatus TaxID=7654 RepID=UPI001BB20780|nr:uncharacterized protein LOC121412519 [Lytechinus variegatus]